MTNIANSRRIHFNHIVTKNDDIYTATMIPNCGNALTGVSNVDTMSGDQHNTNIYRLPSPTWIKVLHLYLNIKGSGQHEFIPALPNTNTRLISLMSWRFFTVFLHYSESRKHIVCWISSISVYEFFRHKLCTHLKMPRIRNHYTMYFYEWM